jgi:glycosyltransferase involved in cell wall biosynthesis
METITQLLLSELDRRGPGSGIRWQHVNTAVNRTQRGREQFSPMKVQLLARQLMSAAGLALRGYDAYYPISQNRIGLLRDIVLLSPFRLARRGIVLHLHGGALEQVLSKEPRWLRRTVQLVVGGPRVRGIVLTPSLRRCLEPLVPVDRIRVLPNAVAAPPGADGSRDGHGELRVLFLSTLMTSKGYRPLVRAVTALARAGARVRLELAGEPLFEQDREWIAVHSRDPAIEYRGPLAGAAKWDALRRAHVLALPSLAPEGQPLAILEGMAAGCAILTTARGGIPETVDDSHGAVLDPLPEDALAPVLEQVLRRWSDDPVGVVRAGQAARARYEQAFAPDRFIEQWLARISDSRP